MSSFSLRSASDEEEAVVTQASDPSDNAWIIRSKDRAFDIPLDASSLSLAAESLVCNKRCISKNL